MAAGRLIRVAIVDDQEMIRAGLRLIVENTDEMTVVGEAGDGSMALDLVDRATPDVVVMDLRMPLVDGIEATRRIAERPGPPAVLVLTTFDDDEHVFGALRAGAAGFLLKDSRPEDLLHAIRVVHDGRSLVAPGPTRRLVEQWARLDADGIGSTVPGSMPADHPALTAREHEVLAGLARGSSNRELAAALFLSEATVKSHVSSLLAKLGLRSRVQAVVFAYETGIVRPGLGG